MKILIDKYIPLIKELLEPYCEVCYLAPDEFTSDTVATADALIVRTRVKCNAALLEGSAVRFIASATIGFDHIDTEYCHKAGIAWCNAPGCNADSVMNYVDAAVRYALPHFEGKTIGIVGVGNVGSRVYRQALAMGMRPLLNDPPLEAAGSKLKFTTLEQIAKEADIITFHVPLDSTTRHLINSEFLNFCKPDAVIINASRGAVLNTADALRASQKFVIDCWENEPEINRELLSKTVLGTPHIAGYSLDGKANGTIMAVNAVSEALGLGVRFTVGMLNLPPVDYSKKYDIAAESNALKQEPEKFEWFRNNYPVRRDLIQYK